MGCGSQPPAPRNVPPWTSSGPLAGARVPRYRMAGQDSRGFDAARCGVVCLLLAIEVSGVGIAHLHAGGEVLAPARGDGARGVGVAEQLGREPRLEAGVDQDRTLVGQVVAVERDRGGVDV